MYPIIFQRNWYQALIHVDRIFPILPQAPADKLYPKVFAQRYKHRIIVKLNNMTFNKNSI